MKKITRYAQYSLISAAGKKSEDGKTFTWTGNVKDDNQEIKFALLQQSIIGDVQLMPNMGRRKLW